MRLEPTSPTAVFTVALHMRQRDRAEFKAVFGPLDAPAMATRCACQYGSRGDCFVVVDDRAGRDVAVGGFLEMRPGVATLLMFATDDFARIGLAFTRKIRAMMAAMERDGMHRFECFTLAGYERMHDWLELIGLRAEGLHRKWGAQNEDFISYAKVT